MRHKTVFCQHYLDLDRLQYITRFTVKWPQSYSTLWVGGWWWFCSYMSVCRRLLFVKSERRRKNGSSIHVSFTASTSGPNLCFLMNTCGTVSSSLGSVKQRCTHKHTDRHTHLLFFYNSTNVFTSVNFCSMFEALQQRILLSSQWTAFPS